MPNYRREFAKVYGEYVEKIYRFIFLKVDSQEVAEDLTAQVFAKGWRRYKRGEDIKNLPAYLYQIARAELADHYRQKSKFPIISTEAGPIVDPSPTVEEDFRFQSDLELVRACLNKLGEEEQNVLVWRYIDGYSNREIAEMLEKSEGAVRVIIHRALKALREQLEK